MGLHDNYSRPVFEIEKKITAMRNAALGVLLADGCDVIVDEMNLRAQYVRALMEIAQKNGATVEIIDFSHVSVDECIARDKERSDRERIGANVIQSTYDRYLASLNGKPLPLPTLRDPVQPKTYEPPSNGIIAVMVDLDGTIALLDRSPYDEASVSFDRPNTPVIATIRALYDAGHSPVFMSGRTEGCRVDTERWIIKHMDWMFGAYGESRPTLFMRAIGDRRPDDRVKLELFDRHVRDVYDVRMVFDDRDSVVKLWRSMGLSCMQVNYGDF
jgi:hypothetical protein